MVPKSMIGFVAPRPAIRSSFSTHSAFLTRRLRQSFSILKNHHDADDVVQETFLRVFKSLSGFRFESSFRTWLITVTIRQSLNHLTRKRSMDTSLDAHAEALGEHPALLQAETQFDQALDEEQLMLLREALAQLPPRQQEALRLRLETGNNYETIAQAMGTSVGSIKSHIHHAIRHLSQSLGKPKNDADLPHL